MLTRGGAVARGAGRHRRTKKEKRGSEEVVEAADETEDDANQRAPGRGGEGVVDPEADEREAYEGGCQLYAEPEAPVRRET